MATSPVTAVFFDLGGVLVELTGEQHMLGLLGHRMTLEQMWQIWLHSSAVRAHETGSISAESFARAVVTEFGLDISPEAFLAGFRTWIKAPFAGARELVSDVSARYTTAILTNTSAVHWPIIDAMGFASAVDHVVASHLIGAVKPDRTFFQHALTRLNLTPDQTVFFDDNQINVDGAQSCGIAAFRVVGINQTRSRLIELGLLPA